MRGLVSRYLQHHLPVYLLPRIHQHPCILEAACRVLHRTEIAVYPRRDLAVGHGAVLAQGTNDKLFHSVFCWWVYHRVTTLEGNSLSREPGDHGKRFESGANIVLAVGEGRIHLARILISVSRKVNRRAHGICLVDAPKGLLISRPLTLDSLGYMVNHNGARAPFL